MSTFRRRLLYAKPKEVPNYLCFTALESGTFTLTIGANLGTNLLSYVEYSLDGNTWVKTNNVNSTIITITTPTVNAGDKVYWRGSGTRNSPSRETNTNNKGIFSSTCKFDISGNIASYLFGKNYKNATLTQRAFVGLFMNCTNLVNAQDLETDPISTNYDDYAYLFYGCTSLLTSPDLSKIPINEYIFAGMFQGCTSLVSTSELPQTALMRNCYDRMYMGCTALTVPSPIGAKVFKQSSCSQMYYGCTHLTKAAAMTVDDAENSAFWGMYQGCTLLTDAENITINSFSGTNICQNMFRQCSSLVDKIPTINASSITNGCFTYMYYLCSNLTKAHSFPALTLLPTCYSFMYHSTKVNYVKMYATDISATNCLTNWLYAVPNNSSCIFVKNINAQWTDTGWSAVPTNWTVIYYDPALDKYYLDQQRNEECDKYGNYKAVEATTNPEAMAVIYAQGWSASPDYMTFSEASAVTDIRTYFRNAGITHFMEFIHFTGVTTIKTNAFSGNNSLVSLCIPRNVTTIQNFGIVGGPLEYLYIPSSVTTIVGSANFSNTSNVRFELHVDDLDSYVMLDIEQQLFKGTTNNPDYYFYEGETLLNSAVVLETATKIGTFAFAGYNKISSITIPNSVLTIGNNAFDNARYGFTNFIDIGSGVTSIGNQAFADVRSCPTLICRAMTAPTLGTNIFRYWGYNIPTAERKLIVPVGAVGYDTDQWKTVLQDQRGYQLIYSDEL